MSITCTLRVRIYISCTPITPKNLACTRRNLPKTCVLSRLDHSLMCACLLINYISNWNCYKMNKTSRGIKSVVINKHFLRFTSFIWVTSLSVTRSWYISILETLYAEIVNMKNFPFGPFFPLRSFASRYRRYPRYPHSTALIGVQLIYICTLSVQVMDTSLLEKPF